MKVLCWSKFSTIQKWFVWESMAGWPAGEALACVVGCMSRSLLHLLMHLASNFNSKEWMPCLSQVSNSCNTSMVYLHWVLFNKCCTFYRYVWAHTTWPLKAKYTWHCIFLQTMDTLNLHVSNVSYQHFYRRYIKITYLSLQVLVNKLSFSHQEVEGTVMV